MTLSDFELLARLPQTDRRAMLAGLDAGQQRYLPYDWQFHRHDGQTPPRGDWRVWLIMAGRGFGKTRAGAEWVRSIAERDGTARIALVGATLHEARAVMVEGESGLLAVPAPWDMPLWEPSLRRLRWRSGAVAMLYGAAEPEALRGPQHSHAWCDEIGKWPHGETVWANLSMTMRLGRAPQIVATTTPRPVALVRRLVADAGIPERATAMTGGASAENRGALAPGFLAALEASYGGTRLARQEMQGVLIAEAAGALWTRALIERCRVRHVPGGEDGAAALRRVVVGVDPPAGPVSEDSRGGDACGIVVVGLGQDGRAYVIEDASVEGRGPEGWARAVAQAAHSHDADRVIAEANNGGAMVASVLRAVDAQLPVRLVHASRGKSARAEPVAALYEAGRVSHRGGWPDLEDQMCGLIAGGGYEGPGRSPDRADALVWALSELMLGKGGGEVRVRGI